MEVVIKEVSELDYSDIFSLYKEEGWTNFSFETICDIYSASIGMVVQVDQKIVGVIRAITDTKLTLFICELIVDKNYRRQGYGRKLIEEVHSLYPNTQVELISDANNFYESLGFRTVGSGMRRK